MCLTAADEAFPSVRDDVKDIAQLASQASGEGCADLQPHEVKELARLHTEKLTGGFSYELVNGDIGEGVDVAKILGSQLPSWLAG